MNRLKVKWIAAFSIIGLAASICALKAIHAPVVATYWREQLASVRDDRVEIVIGQIAELDKAGIAILVEALGSDRERVAQAAKQELLGRIKLWQKLSVNQCALRLTLLTEALEHEVDYFKPKARKHAMDLAVEVLIGPLRGNVIGSDKLLARCEKVLRTGLTTRVEFADVESTGPADFALLKTEAAAHSSKSASLEPAESGEQSNVNLTPLTIVDKKSPGKAVFLPAQPGEDKSLPDSQSNRPRLLDGRQTSHRLGSLDRPAQVSRISDQTETADQTGRKTTENKKSTTSDQVRSLAYAYPKVGDRQSASSTVTEDTVNLMRDLSAADESKAAAVEAELIRRGFSKVQLDISRRMFDPDPDVRKMLIRQLPSCQGVDPVPWLLLLCRDADAEVRLSAITFLATASNPAVLDEIEQIASRDTDASVRQIGDRIAQQRNGRQR